MDKINRRRGLETEAMETEEELNKQLEDILTKIDKARRELKALRGHPAEAPRGKPGASFFAGKERMIEAEETAKHLDTLKQQEREIRAKLHPDKH
jgi:hypothetical protein